MEEIQARIDAIVSHFCISEAAFNNSKEFENNSILSNLVDMYIEECFQNEKSIKIIPLFEKLFPSKSDATLLIYFSGFLISSLSKHQFSQIPDFLEFIEDKLTNLYSVASKSHSNFDPLMDFSAHFYSSFLQTYHSHIIPLIGFFFSEKADCFEKLYIQIDFPPFLKDDIPIVSNLIITNFETYPKFCLNLLKALINTSSENIQTPALLSDEPISKLLTFLYEIIQGTKNQTSYPDLLKLAANTELSTFFIKISEKYFSISNDPELKDNFIQFMHMFKNEKHLTTQLTPTILGKMTPDNIEQAYKFVREIGRYFISHLDSASLPFILKSIQAWTEYCLEHLVPDETEGMTQFINFISSSNQEVAIYPYIKIERLCFYLFFNSSSDIRVQSLHLLETVSKLFEKENQDWKDYELPAQPFYHMLHREIISFVKKNEDPTIDFNRYIEICDPKFGMLHLARRITMLRVEFAAKILKETLELGKHFPFMINILVSVMTPFLLRQKLCRKIKSPENSVFFLAKKYNVESLSLLEPSYFLLCLETLRDYDIESLYQLSQCALKNIKVMKLEQIQEEIIYLCSIIDISRPLILVKTIQTVVDQLVLFYPTNKTIDLSKFASKVPLYLFNLYTTTFHISEIRDTFLSASQFLISNQIDYPILFLDQCDMAFFELSIEKFREKIQIIAVSALHQIPHIVCSYFLTNDNFQIGPESVPIEIIAYLYSDINQHTELITQFRTKYSKEVSKNKKSVVDSLPHKQQIEVLSFSISFYSPHTSIEVTKCILETIELIGSISNLPKTQQTGLLELFLNHPQIAPFHVFYQTKELSISLFTYLIQHGVDKALLGKIFSHCEYRNDVSDYFISKEWVLNLPTDQVDIKKISHSSLTAFKQITMEHPKIKDPDLLYKCGNRESYQLILRKRIKKELKSKSANKMGKKFFISCLANSHKHRGDKKRSKHFDMFAEIFITEVTEAIRTKENHNIFTKEILSTFFDVCITLISMGTEPISNAVFEFARIICTDGAYREKMLNTDFFTELVKLAMINDQFYSLVNQEIKDEKLVNKNDLEAQFFFSLIFNPTALLDLNEFPFEYLFQCILKTLEFDSVILQQKCMLLISELVRQLDQDLKMPNQEFRTEFNIIRDFYRSLTFLKTVNKKYAFDIASFLETIIDTKNIQYTEASVDTCKSPPSNVLYNFEQFLLNDTDYNFV